MKEPQITVSHDMLLLIAEIDEFKGQWKASRILSPQLLKKLHQVATIESAGSSTRIEGAKLSYAQVETLLSNFNPTLFITRDEQEVAGYADAMKLVFESYESLHLTENHIQQLHQILLCYSSKDEWHRGSYKKLSNSVVAKDADGRVIGVVFETATPFDTPREMEELVRWTSKALDDKTTHPLLAIAVFTVLFLAIHPFQDGNGRLSRILTTLLLLRAGYEYVPYASLESIVEENKDLYYKTLRRTQTTHKNDDPDWEPWLGFFMRCLKRQKDSIAIKIEKAKSTKDSSLPTLSVKVLKLLGAYERLTIAQLIDYTGANQNTMKVRLRELVSEGLIRRYGKARATWYSLS